MPPGPGESRLAPSQLLHGAQGFVDDLRLALFFFPFLQQQGALVAQFLKIGLLASELQVALVAVGRQRPGLDGLLHGTAWLVVMLAVTEATSIRQAGNFCERFVEHLIAVPELQLAQPGRIDDETAGGTEDHMPVHARVAASLVPIAHVAGLEYLLANQTIDDRLLPDA